MALALPRPRFDFYVVLDFEAAFDKPSPANIMEIIEMPSVVVHAETATIVAEFQRYVRPVLKPKMHPEVTTLTGITQELVDAAQPFPHVYAEYRQWLRSSLLAPALPASDSANTAGFRSFAFVTCGDWDIRKMLPVQVANCGGYEALHRDEPADAVAFSRSLAAQWINLKHVFNRVEPRANVKGMTCMLKQLQLPLVGRHHSGIDDCRNIAAVLMALLRRGVDVDITATVASAKDRKTWPAGGAPGEALPGKLPEFHGPHDVPLAPSTLSPPHAPLLSKPVVLPAAAPLVAAAAPRAAAAGPPGAAAVVEPAKRGARKNRLQ